MPGRLTAAPDALGFPKNVPIVMGDGHSNRGLSSDGIEGSLR